MNVVENAKVKGAGPYNEIPPSCIHIWIRTAGVRWEMYSIFYTACFYICKRNTRSFHYSDYFRLFFVRTQHFCHPSQFCSDSVRAHGSYKWKCLHKKRSAHKYELYIKCLFIFCQVLLCKYFFAVFSLIHEKREKQKLSNTHRVMDQRQICVRNGNERKRVKSGKKEK